MKRREHKRKDERVLEETSNVVSLAARRSKEPPTRRGESDLYRLPGPPMQDDDDPGPPAA